MDFWPSSLLQELAINHTVIIFDNRGVGNTTAGTNPFSIQQFANDTAGLLAALKIQKADVLGFSMGSSVAQELALLHPEMVNKLVLYGASCGGREGIPPNPQIMKLGQKVLFNPNFSSSILRNPTNQTVEFLPLLIPQKWITENPDFITKFFTFIRTLKEVDPPATIAHQIQAEGTWTGVCDQLPKISSPTLVITGTDDVLVPPTNSLIIVQKIPGSWLVQINGAGHGLVYQYPDQFTKIVKTFLELG
jgi:pimeloyl-ACP methyl ester carboxylesterase